MAVVAFTEYYDDTAAQHCNTYVSDGHGDAPNQRVNRYLSDGHGGSTVCRGHRCPSDPTLATAHMHAVRLNYERQHSIDPHRTKKSVTHAQIYLSWPESDSPSPEECIAMAEELISRTELKWYPLIYIPHSNTPDPHCHLSVCPYREDGSKKLCLNNALLYDLRRQLDYISAAHGYSIVDAPELRCNNLEYREWFFRIKSEGKNTIHPPRDPEVFDAPKRGSKRARS